MEGKQEQLVQAGERQRSVSGSERGNTRWALAGIRGGIRGKSRVRIKLNFVPFQSTAGALLWYDLDISHLSSFIFLWSPPVLLFSVFALFLSPNLPSSSKSAHLLLSRTPSIMWHKQLCQRGPSFNSSCPHFIRPLSQPPLSLPSRSLFTQHLMLQYHCNVLQGHHRHGN